MKISTKWIKHCKTQEERKIVLAKVQAARPAFELLQKMIKEEIASKRKNTNKKDRYESPSWAFYQADSMGEERALNSLLKLINIKNEEEK